MIKELSYKFILENSMGIKAVIIHIESGDNIYAIEEYLIDQCDFFHYNSNDPHNNIEAKLSDISDGRLYFMLTASSLNTRNKTKYLTILHHEELEYYLNVQKSVVIPSKRIIRLLKLKELNIND